MKPSNKGDSVGAGDQVFDSSQTRTQKKGNRGLEKLVQKRLRKKVHKQELTKDFSKFLSDRSRVPRLGMALGGSSNPETLLTLCSGVNGYAD